MAVNRVLARYLSAIAVASFETPAAAGMSRTGVASSPSTRTTFALRASDSSDRSSKSSVYASRVCASNAVSWEGTAVAERGRVTTAATMPSVLATIGTY